MVLLGNSNRGDVMDMPTPCACGETVELNDLRQCTLCRLWYCRECTEDINECPNCIYPNG